MNKDILSVSIENVLPMIENRSDYNKISKIFGSKTIGEFLDRNKKSDTKRKVFSKQCDELESDIRNLLESATKTNNLLELSKEIVIPYFEDNREYSLKEKIDLFLKQYVEKLYLLNKTATHAKIINLFYGLENEYKTEEEIGDILKLTRERVRQLRVEAMNLINGELFFNFKIDSDFQNQINKLKEECLYNDTQKFKELIGNINASNEEIEKIIDIISLSITGLGDDINYATNQQFIVKNDEVVKFKECIRAVIKILQDEFLPLPINSILSKTKRDREDFIRKILRKHNWIEKIENYNEKYYQLKWQHLSSVTSKAKRIIFEAAKQITKDEILVEFNRRSENDPINREQLFIKNNSNDNFHAQKNGCWYYSELKKQVVEMFIDRYIRDNNGKVLFNDVCQAVKNAGYKYPENTIRAYTVKYCLTSKNNDNLFIHKDFKNIYPDIEIQERRQQNVGNVIFNIVIDYLKQSPDNKRKQIDCINYVYNKKVLNITKANISQYIKKIIDTNIVIKEGTAKKYNLILDVEELQKYDLENIGKRNREPEWRKKVRSLVINHLKKQDDYKERLSKLYKFFSDEIPDKISHNVFYKLFNDNSLFRKEGNIREQYIILNRSLLPEAKAFTENVFEPVSLEKPVSSEQEKITYEPFDLEKLKMRLLLEIRGYFDEKADVKEAINLFIEYVKVKSTLTVWGEGILKSIYDLFYSKTDYYDRDSYLYRIVMNYEAYLKNINQIKDNVYDLTNVRGLFDTIGIIEETRQLKERDADKNTMQGRFAKTFSSLNFYRNKYAHNATELEFSLFQQVKTAIDIIALYVYTAWLLRD